MQSQQSNLRQTVVEGYVTKYNKKFTLKEIEELVIRMTDVPQVETFS